MFVVKSFSYFYFTLDIFFCSALYFSARLRFFESIPDVIELFGADCASSVWRETSQRHCREKTDGGSVVMFCVLKNFFPRSRGIFFVVCSDVLQNNIAFIDSRYFGKSAITTLIDINSLVFFAKFSSPIK